MKREFFYEIGILLNEWVKFEIFSKKCFCLVIYIRNKKGISWFARIKGLNFKSLRLLLEKAPYPIGI